MPIIHCPACNHAFDSIPVPDAAVPDASVVNWFRANNGKVMEHETAAAYVNYLNSRVAEPPAPRQQFVATLAYLGVDEVLDGENHVLVQD